MARPSKLTPQQWAEVERRLLAGETARALGREFGISEASIRGKLGTNRALSAQSAQVQETAQKLADAHTALAALPPAQRGVAIDLSEKLRSISNSLASGAELSARNFHRLSALANTELQKVDDCDLPASEQSLKVVSVLTKMANEAAASPLNLLAANKDTVKRLGEGGEPVEDGLPVGELSTEALAEIMRARDAAVRR